MPTVIDSLVVLLGLDPKGFTSGSDKVREANKKTRDEVAGSGKDIELFGKRASSFMSSLRNEAVGLFLAFQGASSIKGFVTDLIAGDAATGRLAGNIGLTTRQLSAWQLAVGDVGGEAAEAAAALTAMADARQKLMLEGSTGHDQEFRLLGITPGDLQNPAQTLLKIAEAGERMDKVQFYNIGKRLGLTDGVINLLEKGRKGVIDLVHAKELNGAASDADARSAAAFQEKLNELKNTIMREVRPALYSLVDGSLKFVDQVGLANIAVPILIGGLSGIAVAAAAALGPIGLLAAGLATIASYAVQNKDNVGGWWVWAKGVEASAMERMAKIAEHEGNHEAAIGWQKKALAIREEVRTALDDHYHFNSPGGGGGTVAPDGRTTAEIRQSFPGYQPPRRGGGGGGNAGIESALVGMGLTADQARGIAAGITAEGGAVGAVNPTSGAFGIGQWLGPRKKRLMALYGPNPSMQQQLAFLVSELRGGDPGGRSVLAQNSAEGTMTSYLRDFMRPGKDLPSDLRRGYAALGGTAMAANARRGTGGRGGGGVTIGTMTVQTQATDAAGIARDLPGAIRRRGLTAQAATGMD